jgi:hypothetical protein
MDMAPISPNLVSLAIPIIYVLVRNIILLFYFLQGWKINSFLFLNIMHYFHG